MLRIKCLFDYMCSIAPSLFHAFFCCTAIGLVSELSLPGALKSWPSHTSLFALLRCFSFLLGFLCLKKAVAPVEFSKCVPIHCMEWHKNRVMLSSFLSSRSKWKMGLDKAPFLNLLLLDPTKATPGPKIIL